MTDKEIKKYERYLTFSIFALGFVFIAFGEPLAPLIGTTANLPILGAYFVGISIVIFVLDLIIARV